MRAVLDRILTIVLLAAALVAALYGHQDLWRLVIRRGAEVAPNWRLLLPLGVGFAAGSALLLLHADAVARALAPRRALKGAHGGAAIALAVAVAALANLVAARSGARIDVTATRSHTLAAASRDALERLPGPVEAIAVLPPDDPWYAAVRALLEAFADAAPARFRPTFLHPWQEGARLAARLEALRVPASDLPERAALLLALAPRDDLAAATLRHGESARPPRTRVFALDELVGVERDGPAGAPRLVFRGEAALTAALIEMARPAQPLVGILAGRAERALAGAAAPPPLGRLVAALRAQGLRVEPLASPGEAGRPAVPLGCEVIIAVAPRARLDPGEHDALARWTEAGGRLLVLGEPVFAEERVAAERAAREAALARLLGGFGVGLAGESRAEAFDVAVEPVPEAGLGAAGADGAGGGGGGPGGAAPAGSAEAGGLHPFLASAAARGAPLRFWGAEALGPAAGGQDAEVTPVLVARRGADAREVPLIVASRRRFPEAAREARLVLTGDADFAADLLVDRRAGTANLDVLLAAIRWLAELDARPPAVESRAPVITSLDLDADGERRMWLLCLLEVPGACALIGLAMSISRRR